MTQADEPPRDDLEIRLRFETLLADLSAGFVNLRGDKVDGAIIDAQRRICEFFDLDRSALWQAVGSATGPWWLTHFHQLPDVPLIVADPTTERSYAHGNEPPTFGNPPVELRGEAAAFFPWLVERLRRGETFVLFRIEDLPAEAAADKDMFRRIGTKSTVLIPLRAGGVVNGVLTFAAMQQERTWAGPLVQRLHLVADVFSSALARKHAEHQHQQAVEDLRRLRDQLHEENIELRAVVAGRQHPAPVAGQSRAIRTVLAQAQQVAPTASTVLLIGETGTGKERFASLIHEQSPRRQRPMVRVNCAAIPATLIESELFGREKGAYTGALSRQAGRFELAHGSTLFLDEIGDLPHDVQVKLLRVLEERKIERLGSSRSIPIDVRIIAATNQDLEAEVRDGRFRDDLYYRLNVFPIVVPPLRERREDIPLLAQLFVEEFAMAMGKRIDAIARSSMDALTRYAWPGNVRELRNVIERAMILATGHTLKVDVLHAAATPAREPSRELKDVERAHIVAVLEQTGWRIRGQNGAARILAIKPTTLETRMAKLGIHRPSGSHGAS
jgi:transcriptional regulator with GAF, ATPase, and Fis domain